MDEYIPPFDPYLYQGTLDTWDEEELRKAFSRAPYIEVGEKPVYSDHPIPIHGYLTVGGVGGPFMGSHIGSVDTSSIEAATAAANIWSLKVTKVGLLHRKGERGF